MFCCCFFFCFFFVLFRLCLLSFAHAMPLESRALHAENAVFVVHAWVLSVSVDEVTSLTTQLLHTAVLSFFLRKPTSGFLRVQVVQAAHLYFLSPRRPHTFFVRTCPSQAPHRSPRLLVLTRQRSIEDPRRLNPANGRPNSYTWPQGRLSFLAYSARLNYSLPQTHPLSLSPQQFPHC